jgi:hypothetical protein
MSEQTSQSMQALALANEAKRAQSAVLKPLRQADYRTGLRLLAAELRDPSEATGSIRLSRLLAAPHRVGMARTRDILRDGGILPTRLTRRVRDLTQGERQRLAAAVELRARAKNANGPTNRAAA